METREIYVAVQLDKFKNIELFKQGLYQIRVRVSYEQANKIVLARPLKLYSSPTKELQNSSRNVIGARILDEFSCFTSRVILVRYQEETVNFLESCVFSCKIPESKEPFPVKIHADLYFTNLENKTAEKTKIRVLNQKPIFRCVVSKEYIITNVFTSMSHYFPMSFDPKFFCSLESIVHVYTMKYLHIKTPLFGNSVLVGGMKVDRVFYSLIDPLFLSYSQIKKLYGQLEENDLEAEVPWLKTLKSMEKNRFFETMGSHDAAIISDKIFSHIDELSKLTRVSFEKLLEIGLRSSGQTIQILKKKFEKEVWEHFQEYIQIEEVGSELASFYTHQSKSNMMAFEIRDNDYFNHLESLPLQADDLYNTNTCHPIFFIHSDFAHINSLIDDTSAKCLDIHVMFLVHGYKGSSVDMHMIKGYINMIYPSVHVYSAKCNENFTDCNIDILGENLAEEVLHHLYEIRIPKSRLRISFIGHSQGGLIIRAALPALSDFQSCMFSMITFSSPHIGIVFAENSLLRFGKWVLKKIQKSTSFSQMIMKDSKDLKNSFLYKLSEATGLNWFPHIILFICTDDPYVPVDSAGMFIPPGCIGTKKEEFFTELVENLLKKVSPKNMIRIDVNFRHKQFLDSCICCGNRHIDFLDDPCFIKMFCYTMPKLFL